MKLTKENIEKLKKAALLPKDGPAWIVGEWDRKEEEELCRMALGLSPELEADLLNLNQYKERIKNLEQQLEEATRLLGDEK